MKKKLLSCLCICFLVAASESAFAAAGDSSQVGTTVTVGQTAATSLTYNASPSVSMNVKATTSAYSIETANILTTKTNGQEYGTKSTSSGYAQRNKTTASGTSLTANGPTVAAQTATSLDTGTAWTWMGGS